jgi:hypothetical protein
MELEHSTSKENQNGDLGAISHIDDLYDDELCNHNLADTNPHDDTPQGTEVQNMWSTDSDLTNIDRVESRVTQELLVEIQRNWRIEEIADMIAEKTWLKGMRGKTPVWELDTLRAFLDLSRLTKGKEHQTKADLEKIYDHRYHGRYGFKKAVGTTWDQKQMFIRQDIKTIIERIKKTPAEQIELDNEASEGKETEPPMRKDTGSTAQRVESRSRKRTCNEADTDHILAASNTIFATKAVGKKAQLNAPNLPLPPVQLDIDIPTDSSALKTRLHQHWNLSKADCTDAIPVDLRPSQASPSWNGKIQKWGNEPGFVLKEIYKLSYITQGRHADVVAKLREIVATKERRATGIRIADLDRAYKWFAGGEMIEDED